MTVVTILHTNDFHNHLDDRKAEIIRREKNARPGALLLDAGDAVSAGNVGARPGGERILERMTELGYDAMTLGNREFHVADTVLRLKVGKAGFPVLCANMRWREDRGETLPVATSIVKQVDDVRVGVFGLTVPMVTARMAARVVSAYLFDDPVESARAEIARMRSGVDLLIALTHIGIREDERLAASCPELDLIIGGHSHVVLPEPQTAQGAPIVQGGWFGHYLGLVEITVAKGEKPVVAGRLIAMRDENSAE